MGYFSNGSEGMDYQEHYCSKCIHDEKQSCPVWLLHLLHNYEECNKPDSFLHVLIPRTKTGANGQCTMFLAGRAAAEGSADETGESKSGAGSASDGDMR